MRGTSAYRPAAVQWADRRSCTGLPTCTVPTILHTYPAQRDVLVVYV